MGLAADDYLIKSCVVEELLSSVESRLRRFALVQKQLDDLRLYIGKILSMNFAPR
jgi:DNA-binding response OmpR family regulator